MEEKRNEKRRRRNGNDRTRKADRAIKEKQG
jgi:hypothetical protein